MKRITLAVIAAMMLTAAIPASAAAQGQGGGQTSGLTIPVVGSVGGVNVFEGAFQLQRFVATATGVAAQGVLTGVLRDAAGNVIGSVVRTLSIPLGAATTATCDILHLELGPLDLDLLGLQVHLNQIVLDIDAQSGPGNLLGNLLCSVAGLLDNPNALANLLNRILGILG